MKISRFILVSLLLIIAIACDKEENEYVREEIVLTVTAGGQDENYSTYLVVENLNSESKFIEIKEGVDTLFKGKEIVGDLINLHFVTINKSFADDWGIESYYELPIGLNINMPEEEKSGSLKSVGSGSTNISFSDIPDFDVATRSASYAGHCHTYGNLEVPCGDQFFIADNFYVCLQKGEEAGYKLVNVPDVNEFNISLDELNYDMTKYSIAKDNDNKTTFSVRAFGSEGAIQIFNKRAEEDSLFFGDFVDVFVPNDIPQMTKIATNVYFQTANYGKSCYCYDDEVTTDYSFLDVGLELDYSTGNIPELSSLNNEFDFIRLYMSMSLTEGGWPHHWNIYLPSTESLYLPDFPEEVTKAIGENFQLSQFFTDDLSINAIANEDSRFNDYYDACDFYLNRRDFNEEKYFILSESTRLY